jgi:hypothetical protein
MYIGMTSPWIWGDIISMSTIVHVQWLKMATPRRTLLEMVMEIFTFVGNLPRTGFVALFKARVDIMVILL